ncbi:multidrug transporter Dtr1p [Diutina catenulata]
MSQPDIYGDNESSDPHSVVDSLRNKPYHIATKANGEKLSEDNERSLTDLGLTDDHYEFLMDKHGTVNLNPLPSMYLEDPLNWSNTVKWIQLVMVAFHGFFCTFQASGQVPAFEAFSEQMEVSIERASYLTSAQIVILGWLPWLWLPIMNRYGRHKLLMLSVLGSMGFNIGSIFLTHSYGALMAMRCLSAFFVSPGIAVGGAVVKETTFAHQRASRSGVWALSVNLGTIAGPIFMGFVVERVTTKWIYVVFSATNFIQFVLYAALGRETLFNPDISPQKLSLVAIRPESPVTLQKFFAPARFFLNWRVFTCAVVNCIVFTYANIAPNVDLPIIFVHKFSMGPQAIGLSFIAFLIGFILGEHTGFLSDWIIRTGKNPHPYTRLWLSYPGFVFAIVGLVIFGVQVQNLTQFNITPLIGLVIGSFGLQMITTTLISFCIDLSPQRASEVVLFITAVRQTHAFVGPFYFPSMFDSLGYLRAFGLMAGLVGASLIPIAGIHYFEHKLIH